MTNANNTLHLDLAYLAEEDRVLLTLYKENIRLDWWLTRRMAVALVSAWIEKLELIGFPQIEIAQFQNPERNLPQEHELSLEFDGPKSKKLNSKSTQNTELIKEVTISVSQVECALLIKAENRSTQLNLTRKESHALLEMISSKARHAGWIEIPNWPNWLGGNKSLSK